MQDPLRPPTKFINEVIPPREREALPSEARRHGGGRFNKLVRLTTDAALRAAAFAMSVGGGAGILAGASQSERPRRPATERSAGALLGAPTERA